MGALNSEASEVLIQPIISELHVYGIFYVFGDSAKLEAEEDAALSGLSARNATEHVASSSERHGECIAELSFGGDEHSDPSL